MDNKRDLLEDSNIYIKIVFNEIECCEHLPNGKHAFMDNFNVLDKSCILIVP